MAIIYRLQKGGPLTATEVDGNFRELHQRLEVLEHKQVDGKGWGSIELRGDELVFLSPLNEILHQFKLPLLRFAPRGFWQPKHAYAVYDVITTGKKVYSCSKAHQSSEDFVLDQEHWQVLLDMQVKD